MNSRSAPYPVGMRAFQKLSPGPGFEMVEVPIPEYGPDDVLIEVLATSICGTDLHIVDWDPWAGRPTSPSLMRRAGPNSQGWSGDRAAASGTLI